jgi:hypothetical protein
VAAKTINRNFTPIISKSFRDYLKSSSGDVFYAAVAFPYRQDLIDYTGSTDSDSVGMYLNADSDIEAVDDYFFSQNTISMHKLYTGGVTRVSKRQDWKNGYTYKAWPDLNSHVLVKTFTGGSAKLNVYRCLFSPLEPSTIPPSETFANPIFTSDNYVWKYLYTISDAESILFLNENWIPVPERITNEEAASLAPGSVKYMQYVIQQNVQYGYLYNVDIDSDIALTDTNLTALTSGGTLEVIAQDVSGNIPSSVAEFIISYDILTQQYKILLANVGKGYVGPVRFVRKSSTTVEVPSLNATLPFGVGHGSNIPDEMFANDIMAVVKNIPEGLVGDLANGNKFNLVSLVKNPIDNATKNIATKNAYIACKAFDCIGYSFAVDEVIKSTAGPANATNTVGRVVAINGTKIYYIHHLKDGEGTVLPSTVHGDSGSGSVVKTYEREVVFNSHQNLLSDFKPIEIIRSPEQTESFSFVVSF